MMLMEENVLMPDEAIAARIHWIRGEKVMLAHDPAKLYGVPTKRLNEAVKRNMTRFPDDFMFQLSLEEWANLRSQIATSSSWGGLRVPPYAFTEHGVLMLSSVLNSDRAIAVNIRIVRVFVRLSSLLQHDRGLQRRMEKLEERQTSSEDALAELFEAVKQLMAKPVQERKRLGYKGGDDV
ncbi:MAG: ORF6N domain-containing protein [Flavobacteriales bacterium]|nr:ORF6N domain-containing protein [Flavobacteriales bacterium]